MRLLDTYPLRPLLHVQMYESEGKTLSPRWKEHSHAVEEPEEAEATWEQIMTS